MSRTLLTGTVQNDVLKEYVARGTVHLLPPLRLADMALRIRWTAEGNDPISISGYHMREAGATAVQEIGFTLQRLGWRSRPGSTRTPSASALLLLRQPQRSLRGSREVPGRAQTLGPPGGSGSGAQHGAAPVPHPDRGRHAPGAAADEQHRACRLSGAGPSWAEPSSLQHQRVRGARAPTEDSATLALRTQQVLGYRDGLGSVVDPLAGSWYVEALTDRIEREARGAGRRGGPSGWGR